MRSYKVCYYSQGHSYQSRMLTSVPLWVGVTHTGVDGRDGAKTVQGKWSRADSMVAKASSTSASGKGARASPDAPPEVSDTER